MNNTYVLSKREKIMLIILGVFLTGFLSTRFLFIPAAEAYENSIIALHEAQIAQIEVLNRMSAIKTLRVNMETDQQRLAEMQPLYRVFLQTEGLEAEFTRFLIENNLQPITVMLNTDTRNIDENGDLIKITLHVRCRALSHDALKSVLRLSDYVNDTYSFRLTSMRAVINNNPVSVTAGTLPSELTPLFEAFKADIWSNDTYEAYEALQALNDNTLRQMFFDTLMSVEADFYVETVLRVIPE